ncbi:hypothetical protein LTR56_000177 [Elasticomyces elasticus]|nr:hypothetical protein LTR56_000177 [Elasticomyces elasticus]KAK3667165.1 hypothetical protein LTR22_002030 [Elasticomyces elasticus]KAK4932939.1 hypothetical protein LTR49_000896 [Elasticomyces elasticus]KAK5768656.1 hypothetical protein LTS12_001081 [Elasticomyces elasticus]
MAMTGLDFEFVDGVTEINNHTLPPGADKVGLNLGGLGNWRAHMNVNQKIVRDNIASALILEDDADWDIRIKSQMRDFAKATRLLVQPLRGTSDSFMDPTYPQPNPDAQPSSFDIKGDDPTLEPSTSPYGDLDRWGMLWIGHCGCRFPIASDGNVPLGRAVIADDETVPEQQHVDMQFGDRQLQSQYPAHTRVVSRSRVNTCTLGYGISQTGARQLLYEMGVHKLSGTTDMMFRAICDGVQGRRLMTCLSVQPQLFQHHRPVGTRAYESDISDPGERPGHNDQAFTRNIRWSTRLNLEKLVAGETDYIDLFKDGEPATNLGWK